MNDNDHQQLLFWNLLDSPSYLLVFVRLFFVCIENFGRPTIARYFLGHSAFRYQPRLSNFRSRNGSPHAPTQGLQCRRSRTSQGSIARLDTQVGGNGMEQNDGRSRWWYHDRCQGMGFVICWKERDEQSSTVDQWQTREVFRRDNDACHAAKNHSFG